MQHRRIAFAIVAAISVALGPGMACSAEKVIVAFGDSTTAPRGDLPIYSLLLQKALAAQGLSTKVVNAGVGGNTTVNARARFEKDVLARNPRLVIIQFGINDAAVNVWKSPPATQPDVSLQDYEANLRYFVQTLRKLRAEAVLMTPNPCRWTKQLLELYGKPPHRPDDPDGYNVLLRRYADAVRRIASQEKTPLVDVYEAFQAYDREPGQSIDDLLLDGMHPNAKGHELVAKLLLSFKRIGWSF
ncbi:MAG: SGNH/GDSL hydrolase family protein [Rhodopirellula sp.]|nr:SGNH/GDSL hydrolase family protein [Rhodopirellula sp.]